MIQNLTDADLLRHARTVADTHRTTGAGDPRIADLLDVVDMLTAALEKHHPVPPGKGWNEAWGKFDYRTSPRLGKGH